MAIEICDQSLQILKQSASKAAFQICQARERCIERTQFPLQSSLECPESRQKACPLRRPYVQLGACCQPLPQAGQRAAAAQAGGPSTPPSTQNVLGSHPPHATALLAPHRELTVIHRWEDVCSLTKIVWERKPIKCCL